MWNLVDDTTFYIGPIESIVDVARLVKSFGVDSDIAKLTQDFRHQQQGTFVTTWNQTKSNAAKLEIAFAGDTERTDGLGGCSENEAIVTLIDCVTGKQVGQHVVPLALIDNPNFLDTLHREWCSS